MTRTGHARHGPTDVAPLIAVHELPVLALSRPRDTALAAERILASSRDRHDRSYAAQALGIATRELGDVRGAVRHLRAALVDASRVGREREADVEASLGATLGVFAGRTREGLRYLDAALDKSSGVAAARIQVRRGFLLQVLGRTSEAVGQLRLSARTLRAAGDGIWEARALINLAQALLDGGRARHADAALTRAETLLNDAGQTFESAVARHNRGLTAALLGQVPEALAHYDAAEEMYAEAGARPPELSEARCAALLAAGLPLDALSSGSEAVELLRQTGASPAYRANALVRAGDAALAAGDPRLARRYANEAVRLFRRQGRTRGETLARLAVIRARYASGELTRRLLRDSAAVAAAADGHRVVEVVEAHLLAGQIALALADGAAARPHLLRAARGRSSGSALGRVLGWHAAALQARAAGRRRGVFEACERGLQTLDTHQLTLGALEMRAAATAHGAQLAALAVREAVAADDSDLLLAWTERWRATAFALPPVRPPDDAELANELGVLRNLHCRLKETTAEGRPVGPLVRECRRLEEEVRRRTLRVSGGVDLPTRRPDVQALLDALGDVRLVEMVRLDDALHVLVATSSGVRHHLAGSWQEVLRRAEFARFALRRLAHNVRPGGGRMMGAASAGDALEKQVLGPAVDDLGDAPVVLVPPASLHSVPWGLLPSLCDRAVSVAPSGAAWLQAREIPPPENRSVALVAGPDLGGCGAEVTALASRYPDANLHHRGTATANEVLASLDGRWLAHLAAHGTFRADNPLFSSLDLDDGPLTLLDLQRLRRAPYRLVVSSCNSGLSAAAGADELLGLFSALAPLGTAGLLAAVVPINDEASVAFSHRIHDRLHAGDTTAEALRQARRSAMDDPVHFATARSFVAFGAV
jgi:tetratricopeptide (TPR) repeat protein